jgi:SAM-dependent methyltransferase
MLLMNEVNRTPDLVSHDQGKADAFASSWNNLPQGSVYTYDQFKDWLEPITQQDVENTRVLELGCGNGSLMLHMVGWRPSMIKGVDLGSSARTAMQNMEATTFSNWNVEQGDLAAFESEGFDVVYCIGVLHHLKDPKRGLDAVIRNTRRGGRFHCWVYAKEGNAVVIALVEPLRRVACKLPWWVNKYLIATPLAVPFYLYAKLVNLLQGMKLAQRLPLYDYSKWIATRGFQFFRHVAFDQLVSPQTTYIPKSTLEDWLKAYPQIDQASIYIIMRNGNSWKFGASLKCES